MKMLFLMLQSDQRLLFRQPQSKKIITCLLSVMVLLGVLPAQTPARAKTQINGASNCYFPALQSDAVVYSEKTVSVF